MSIEARIEQLEAKLRSRSRFAYLGWTLLLVTGTLFAGAAAQNGTRQEKLDPPKGLIQRVVELEQHVVKLEQRVAELKQSLAKLNPYVTSLKAHLKVANRDLTIKADHVTFQDTNGKQVATLTASEGHGALTIGAANGKRIILSAKDGIATYGVSFNMYSGNQNRWLIHLSPVERSGNAVEISIGRQEKGQNGQMVYKRLWMEERINQNGEIAVLRELKLVKYLELNVQGGANNNTGLPAKDWIVGFVGFADAGINEAQSVRITRVGNHPNWHIQLDPPLFPALPLIRLQRKVKLIAIPRELLLPLD